MDLSLSMEKGEVQDSPDYFTSDILFEIYPAQPIHRVFVKANLFFTVFGECSTLEEAFSRKGE